MISVLFLDDDRRLSELCRAFLERCGDIKVDTVATVREALEAIGARRYNAIISDLRLPDGDGLCFLRRVREKDRRIPFIMLTGTNRGDVAVEAYGLGASHYLQKSYDLESQVAEIRHLLRRAVKERETEDELFMARLQAKLVSGSLTITSWTYDDEKGEFRFDTGFADFYRGGPSGEDGRSMTKEEYVRRFVHPDDADMVRGWMMCGNAKDLGSGEFMQTEHRFVRGDGEVRCLLVRVGYFRGGDGHKSRIFGINQDITDLRRPPGDMEKTAAAPRSGDLPRGGFCDLDSGSGALAAPWNPGARV